MSNKIIAFLAVVLALTSLYSFAANSDTQKMNTNQALTAAQQSIVPIAAFTANGEMDKLKTALHQGLDAGLTVNEIKEILVQLYAYAGFPRSLNGLAAFMDVIREREAKGIKDEIGKTADPLPADMSVLALGTEIQTQLSGKPVTGPLFDFAPAIDQFLKTHLFGDIFGRNNLDFQSREIATIAALASMKGVNSQLQAHFRIGVNVGLSDAQLHDLISALRDNVGNKEADNTDEVLSKFINNRTK